MEQTKHSKQCLEAQEKYNEYCLAHPGHCRNCGGSGFVLVGGDFVPYGSTTVQLPDSQEYCSACYEKGKCPRCGMPVNWSELLEQFHACHACGFKEGDSGAPSTECFCLENQVEEERSSK